MKYAFIKTNQQDFSVQLCCELFGVSRSGYYAWSKRKPSQRAIANRRLDIKIKALFAEHDKRAGSPVLHWIYVMMVNLAVLTVLLGE